VPSSFFYSHPCSRRCGVDHRGKRPWALRPDLFRPINFFCWAQPTLYPPLSGPAHSLSGSAHGYSQANSSRVRMPLRMRTGPISNSKRVLARNLANRARMCCLASGFSRAPFLSPKFQTWAPHAPSFPCRRSGSRWRQPHHTFRSPTRQRPSAGHTGPAAERARGTRGGERPYHLSSAHAAAVPAPSPNQTNPPRALRLVRPPQKSQPFFSLAGE
jgi:hypothetical protein